MPTLEDLDNLPIIRILPFAEASGYRFRGTGISGIIPAGTSGNLEFVLPEDRRINGVHLLLKDHVWGDTVKFQIVDKDGIIYPAGTVLDEFAGDWNIDHTVCSQGIERTEYPAMIQQGLYIRIIYTSTGGTDVGVRANLYLHKVPS